MAAQSQVCDFGWKAVDFDLPGVDGARHTLGSARGPRGPDVVLAPDGEATVRTLAPTGPVTVLIGPEGGLAPEERALAVAAGFRPVRFGPRVLRTETAPLAAIAALQALYGDC